MRIKHINKVGSAAPDERNTRDKVRQGERGQLIKADVQLPLDIKGIFTFSKYTARLFIILIGFQLFPNLI